jgi:hypothetical protein
MFMGWLLGLDSVMFAVSKANRGMTTANSPGAGWTRTSNPPVNSLTWVSGLVGSSVV